MLYTKIQRRMVRYIFRLKTFVSSFLHIKELDYGTGIVIYTNTIREYETRANSSKKEPEMIDWIEKNSEQGKVMFDIGANIGAYSLVAAKNDLQVYSFEPAYQNFYQLNNNITLNRMDQKINAFPVAFSTETKVEKFNYLEASIGTSKCFYNEENKYHLDDKIMIRKSTMIYSLDDFIKIFKLPNPYMLKIDVDGAEFDILKGAKKTLLTNELQHLIIEIDDTLNSIDEMKFYLEKHDFVFIEQYNRNNQVYNCIFTKKAKDK